VNVRDELGTDSAQTRADFRGSVSREGGGQPIPTLGGGCGFGLAGRDVSA
jgi:hypothetical protein